MFSQLYGFKDFKQFVGGCDGDSDTPGQRPEGERDILVGDGEDVTDKHEEEKIRQDSKP